MIGAAADRALAVLGWGWPGLLMVTAVGAMALYIRPWINDDNDCED